jgi:hypothetical protein
MAATEMATKASAAMAQGAAHLASAAAMTALMTPAAVSVSMSKHFEIP